MDREFYSKNEVQINQGYTMMGIGGGEVRGCMRMLVCKTRVEWPYRRAGNKGNED